MSVFFEEESSTNQEAYESIGEFYFILDSWIIFEGKLPFWRGALNTKLRTRVQSTHFVRSPSLVLRLGGSICGEQIKWHNLVFGFLGSFEDFFCLETKFEIELLKFCCPPNKILIFSRGFGHVTGTSRICTDCLIKVWPQAENFQKWPRDSANSLLSTNWPTLMGWPYYTYWILPIIYWNSFEFVRNFSVLNSAYQIEFIKMTTCV